MKIILAATLLSFASCARLDSSYLPPNQGGFSSGSSSFSGSGSFPGGSGQGAFSGSGSFSSGSGAGSYSGANSYSGASGQHIPILRLDDNNSGDGTYNYAYETGNGISAQEQGDARGDGTKAHGGFGYTAPDGQQIHIQYTADENGFQAQGAHLPTSPPIPEEIQKALQQNLADEARGIVDDGQYRDDNAGQYRDDGAGQYRGDGSGQYNGQGFGQYNAPASNFNQGGSSSGGYKY